MQVDLSKDQIEALVLLINNSSFKGTNIDFVVKLREQLQGALKEKK